MFSLRIYVYNFSIIIKRVKGVLRNTIEWQIFKHEEIMIRAGTSARNFSLFVSSHNKGTVRKIIVECEDAEHKARLTKYWSDIIKKVQSTPTSPCDENKTSTNTTNEMEQSLEELFNIVHLYRSALKKYSRGSKGEVEEGPTRERRPYSAIMVGSNLENLSKSMLNSSRRRSGYGINVLNRSKSVY